jgi:hypothetical protein
VFAGAPFATSPFAALSGNVYIALINESATGADLTAALANFSSSVSESATGTDTMSARVVLVSLITETATGQDEVSALTSVR